MINHFDSYEDNQKCIGALFSLMSKVLKKEGFLDILQRSNVYRSYVDLLKKEATLINKIDALETVDFTFSQFEVVIKTPELYENSEIYHNWIKSLDNLKLVFSTHS